MPDSNRIITSTRLIAVLTLASRVLGLIREAVLGYFFATSELLSAFRIAFMTPNLLRRLFGEGALASAMIPVLTETLEHDGEEPAKELVGGIVLRVTALLLGLVIASELVIVLWQMYSDDLALRFAAIMLPFMALTCAVAIGGGALQVRGHFAMPAAVPVILNIAMIVSITAAAFLLGYTGRKLMVVCCCSVLLGGIIQVIATGFVLRTRAFFPKLGWYPGHRRIKEVWRLMLPMILGLSAVQVNALVDYVIAYVFIHVDGQRVGPAVLGFAHYLYQLPLGVFGIAVATAVFPVLSKKAVTGDMPGFVDVLQRGIRLSLFVALPAALGLAFVAGPLVVTLFEHGAFRSENSDRVAGTLVMYSLGIPAYFAHHIIVRAYYSMKESATPVRIALSMVGVNLVMNLALVRVLEERGLALATAICATIQVVWLIVALDTRVTGFRWAPVALGMMKSVVATIIMCAVLVAITLLMRSQTWMPIPAWGELAVLVVTGLGSYGAAAKLLGIEELGALLQRGVVDD